MDNYDEIVRNPRYTLDEIINKLNRTIRFDQMFHLIQARALHENHGNLIFMVLYDVWRDTVTELNANYNFTIALSRPRIPHTLCLAVHREWKNILLFTVLDLRSVRIDTKHRDSATVIFLSPSAMFKFLSIIK